MLTYLTFIILNQTIRRGGGYSPLIWAIRVGAAQQGLLWLYTVLRGIQDSLGLWIPRRGFRIPGTWSQSLSVKAGFWIQIVSRIPDSLSCTPESKAQDYGFLKQNFPQFRNPNSLALAKLFTVFQIWWCLSRLAGDIKLLILTKNNSDSALGNHKSVLFLMVLNYSVFTARILCGNRQRNSAKSCTLNWPTSKDLLLPMTRASQARDMQLIAMRTPVNTAIRPSPLPSSKESVKEKAFI